MMKMTTPFLLTHIRFSYFIFLMNHIETEFILFRLRVIIVILASSASFLLVSLSTAQWQAFLGVVFAALSGGLGEVTFLQYSAKYHK